MTTIQLEVPDGTDELLDERETAAMLRLAYRTVRQHRYDGTGPSYLQVGRRVLYRRSAVIDWLLSHEVPAGQRRPAA